MPLPVGFVREAFFNRPLASRKSGLNSFGLLGVGPYSISMAPINTDPAPNTVSYAVVLSMGRLVEMGPEKNHRRR